MIREHTLTPAQFDALASGYGGAATIRALTRAQLSKHLLLVKFIAETWSGDPAHREAAVAVLTRAQLADPVAADDVLTDPLVGVWTAYVTRRLRGSIRSATPLPVDCNHLSSIAVAAAARTGLDARLIVHAGPHGLAIPRLGRADGAFEPYAPVEAAVSGGRVTVAGAEGWLAPRMLAATAHGKSIRVVLDDVDPYRGGHHAPAAPRLADAEVEAWQEVLAAGWQLIARHAPERAEELSEGLRTLVPLVQLDARSARSATIRDAFGAFGLTSPTRAADFAVTVVHEFQHSKLSALLDLVPLVDAGSAELHFAPWRTDPRPTGGLLQGVYAFLGIAGLWGRLLTAAEPAEHEFAVAREQVRWGLDGLERSAALLPAGRRFTAGMRATFDELASVPVAPRATARAEEELSRVHAGWRQRNTPVVESGR
jgi:uncharacterized protein